MFGDSIPWKIVEYMRNGSCIVSQKNKHLFREPIDKGIIANFETPDECIDMVVTSPPYDSLRDYNGYELDLHGLGEQSQTVISWKK